MFNRLCVLILLMSGWAQAVESGLSDPTRPLSSPVAVSLSGQEKVQLKLQQIIERGEQRYALIDGHLVQLNQQLGDYRIRRIEANQVVMEKSDRSLVTLYLFSALKKH